jgi:hypothetical protein
MNLSELGLNRWGYKAVQKTETSDSSDMSSNTPIYKTQSEQIQDKNNTEDASNVLPGTVIKSCIIIANSLTTQSLLIEDIGGNPIGAFSVFGVGNSISLTILNDFGYEFHPNYFTYTYNESEPIVPDVDLGTPTRPWNIVYANQIGNGANKSTLYGNVIACPLPTISNALDIIRKIPEPSYVGERGHFGNGLYFDDLTFPEEVLHDVDGKKEIEHTKMIGLLMKAVVELTEKVDKLEKEVALLIN